MRDNFVGVRALGYMDIRNKDLGLRWVVHVCLNLSQEFLLAMEVKYMWQIKQKYVWLITDQELLGGGIMWCNVLEESMIDALVVAWVQISTIYCGL